MRIGLVWLSLPLALVAAAGVVHADQECTAPGYLDTR